MGVQVIEIPVGRHMASLIISVMHIGGLQKKVCVNCPYTHVTHTARERERERERERKKKEREREPVYKASNYLAITFSTHCVT